MAVRVWGWSSVRSLSRSNSLRVRVGVGWSSFVVGGYMDGMVRLSLSGPSSLVSVEPGPAPGLLSSTGFEPLKTKIGQTS